ncbi:MAG: glycosyltransferase [Planctomycetaceae bacterium]|nr:glycosyltransferase [Planctomycetaceae bacterium]
MYENNRPLIIHDAFTFPGGGEKVAMNLARVLSADILTAKLSLTSFPSGYFDIVPKLISNRFIFPWLFDQSKTMSLATKMILKPRMKYPLTFFSGQVAPLAAFNIDGPKVLYCHTPPRQLYDLHEYYLKNLPFFKRTVRRNLLIGYRYAIDRAIRKMNLVIANSQNVKKRIERYWAIQNVPVVYPPCGESFTWLSKGDYYLSTARHDKLKRVDIIIKAFLKMPQKKIVIASSGPETDNLKTLANNSPNIMFTGLIDNNEMENLVGRCRATIYIPVDEDFGISPVESMAAGKPVIGVNEGGLMETILDGKNGWLLPSPPKPDDLVRLINELTEEKCQAMRYDCEQQARSFSEERFKFGILKAIRNLESKTISG